MPRTALPPTPASSTDITGQDGSKQLASLQMAFELPPPAISPAKASRAAAASSTFSHDPSGADAQLSPKAPYPMQASETVKSRRRSSIAQKPTSDSFTLPPPPARPRKIIQMKPRSAADESTAEPSTSGSKSTARSKTSANSAPSGSVSAVAAPVTASTTAGGSKKKQPSATSAAGRKIARKTAHSLIERRRRSKMNEEFAVLKGMIPACTGEMHKLAILQASIEYVRYLEDCVSKLKAQRDTQHELSPLDEMEGSLPTPSGRDPYYSEGRLSTQQQSPDVDVTMSELPSPWFTANPGRSSNQPSISPALSALDSRHRQDSHSSASTDQRHYSYSASATTSPAFGPQAYAAYPHSTSHSTACSTLTSPALDPQRDLDQEATAALLMLNSDRRGTQGSSSGRGMSVRDLLST